MFTDSCTRKIFDDCRKDADQGPAEGYVVEDKRPMVAVYYARIVSGERNGVT